MSQDNTPQNPENSGSPYGAYGNNDATASEAAGTGTNSNQTSAGYGSSAAGSEYPTYSTAKDSAYNATAPHQYAQQVDYNNYNGYQAPVAPQGRGMATASLVLGVVGILTCWIFGFGGILGLIGLILGIIAVRKLGKTGGSKGLAIGGIITSVIALIAGAVVLAATIWISSFSMDAYEACQQYQDNQVQLEECLTDYASNNLQK